MKGFGKPKPFDVFWQLTEGWRSCLIGIVGIFF